MADFRTYSPEDVINANLQESAIRFDSVCEQELAHLCELAEEILSSGEIGTEWISSLPDHAPVFSFEDSEGIPFAHTAAIGGLRELRASWHKVFLCTALRRQMAAKGPLSHELFFSDTEAIPPNAYNRVVYQKSSYTDAAYLQFAPLLSVPRASYAHSFPSACEDVFNGLCEFCILPVENTAEGQLNGFFRLIERYGLKIAATCDIAGTDATRTTRFALLRRNLTPLLLPGEGKKLFEFTAQETRENTISDLLLASRLCGLKLHRLDFLPRTEKSPAPTARFTLLTEAGDLYAYLLYLAMEIPQYNPVGIYSHVSPKHI